MSNAARDTFAAHLGSTVDARPPDGEVVALRVDTLEDYGEADGTRFSVFLSGPADQPLQQGMHSLRPGGDDPLEVFLVPVGREGDRLIYEVAFNLEGRS